MGLLDEAVPGGNIARPLMIAIGALLVGKMLGGRGEEPEAPKTEGDSAAKPDEGFGGGLGDLLEKLQNAGQRDKVDSWVGTGENAPIQPKQLESALGQQTIGDLARRSGMNEQELLSQLSKVLPGLVDKLTPDGRVPSQQEVASRLL